MDIKNKIVLSSIAAVAALSFTACSSDSSSSSSSSTYTEVDCNSVTYTTPSSTTLTGDLTTHYHLTSDQNWTLSGLVAVKNNSCLKIDAGTKILGAAGTGTNTSYLVIDKGSKIIANGTAVSPIIFTDAAESNNTVGLWGGLTIIGTAANDQVGPYEVDSQFVPSSESMTGSSGSLQYVEILNSGITMEVDKEINGLSLVGVGSGTTVDHVSVKASDDDCIEIWGGTVNIDNAYVEYCTDDQFDIDDGYSGTVTGLTINQHTDGNAGIEMSGTTSATFVDLNLTQNYSDKEGSIFFKKDGIGGHFENSTITDNVDDNKTIVSLGDADEANISFTDVNITSPDITTNFVNQDSTGTAADIEAKFDAGTGNTEN